jgi:DinB family protein
MGTGDAKLRRIIDIASEAQMVNGCAGRTVIELPSGFAERFKRETASVNDPAKLGKKDDLFALLERVRNQTCDWVGTLSAAEMAKPSPEMLRKLVPTVGHVAQLFLSHLGMHLG